MNDIQYAHPRITPTLRRVLAVLSNMPGGATAHYIAEDVYATAKPERTLRCLRSALKLGIEQGMLSVAGKSRNKPDARGPKADVYAITLIGLQHVNADAIQKGQV